MTTSTFTQDISAVLGSLPAKNGETLRSGLAILQARGVDSYDALFALLRDVDTDADTLLKAYDVLFFLGERTDKRRSVWPMLHALKSPDDRIRQQAAWVLGALRSRRAVPYLIGIIQNRDEVKTVRMFAIQALSTVGDTRAVTALQKVAEDFDEDDSIRAEAERSLKQLHETAAD
jgi:HEAT repeat protein